MSQRVLSASFGKREGGVDEIMSEALAIRRVFTDFDAYLDAIRSAESLQLEYKTWAENFTIMGVQSKRYLIEIDTKE